MDTIPQDTPQKQCKGPCGLFLPATTDYFGKHYTTKDKLRTTCKICRRVETKAYHDAHAVERKQHYQEHKEELLIRNRQYRQTHREEIRKQHSRAYQANRQQRSEDRRRYQYEHREEIAAREKRRYQERKARINAYHKRYYAAHKEQAHEYGRLNRDRISKRNKDYRAKHRERYNEHYRAHYHKREALKKNIGGTFTARDIATQLKRQRNKCYYCMRVLEKGPRTRHVDHVIPLSRGGSNGPENLVIACPLCNMHKHDKLLHEWPEGGRLL